jgi:hypothetical protein
MNGPNLLMWVRYANECLRKFKFYEKIQTKLKGQRVKAHLPLNLIPSSLLLSLSTFRNIVTKPLWLMNKLQTLYNETFKKSSQK